MVLDGKYHEAMELAFKEMNKGPIKRNTGPHPVVPAFLMHLDFPKTASAKNYLRTVDFESGEVKVHWSDERGDWVRQAFTSRPDNVVVQLLTAPKGQPVNASIAVQKYSRENAPGRIVRGEQRGQRGSAGLQRAAADLQVPPGSLRGQQRLRRSGSRGSERRLGPDGRRHAGHRERIVGDAAHPHRMVGRLQ